MKIYGYPIHQGGAEFYAGVVGVNVLLERIRVDTFSSVSQDGYQRSLSAARARAFGRYILGKNYSPLSILVNVREADAISVGEGIIEVRDDVELWVVDGQHRVEGFRFATQQDPEVGLMLMNQPSGYQEAWQFITINKTQKGVRTDLAERFLDQALKREGRAALQDMRDQGALRGMLRNIEWVGKALAIADELNAGRGHAWYGKIRLPNEPKYGTLVAQKSFTDSLEPILKDAFFQGKDSHAIAAALGNYWDAITELTQAAFDSPQDHVIQKTTGVFVMHRIFPRVSELCRDKYGNRVLTRERIKSVLGQISMMTADYWASNGPAGKRGTSKKAFSVIALEMLESLEEAQSQSAEPDLVT